ncbi:hypothetical protein Tco_0760179 [Tanacetum coccineum]
MAAAMKHMVANFSKLNKFEGVDFRRWRKKMHFCLSTMSVVYVLNIPNPDKGDDGTVEQIRRRNKWVNDDYVCRGINLNNFKHTLKHKKEESILVELGSHLRIEESLRVQDSDEPKGNNVVDPSVVNMMEHNNSTRTENIGGSVVLEKVTEEDDPKTINETMKSHDVALWKEAIDDEMDSIMGNNTSIIHEMDISII